MFTGITTNKGVIQKITSEVVPEYHINTDLNLRKIAIGSSIMCSGICLTVIKVLKNSFVVNISEETLQVTNAKDWKIGTVLNLEKSLCLGDELGGHIVTGHVDCISKLKKVQKLKKSIKYNFSFPTRFEKFISVKGSITVDGISLTVNKVKYNEFSVNLIPHTLNVTTLGKLEKNDKVNLEVDILARYIDKNINSK